MRIGKTPIRAVLAALASTALAAGLLAATAGPALAQSPPALNGSFIQPTLADDLSSSQLATEDGYLTRAGLSQQVLQWTADSGAGTTVYPSGLSGYTQSTSTDVVSKILTAADNAGLKEYIGLQVNNDWWTNYANDANWLDGQATVSTELADDLYTKYGSHASFAGWYLPFEVDNWNFTTSASWSNMASYYTTVADYLHNLTPGLPVIIAPFFNTAGGLTSSQWTTMWESILGSSPIDVVALQDGIGDGHATTSQLATWYAATQAAIEDASPSTQLWADTETYNTSFEPQSIQTVVADMEAEQPYVSDFLSFSYDHYDSPLQVSSLYDTTYRDYLASGSVETTPPSTPTGLTATDVDAQTIDLSWTASTDNVGVAGYQIYRNGDLVKTIYGSATSYTDSQLDSSTEYTYQVAAFDAAGNVSAESSSASASTEAAPDNSVDLALGESYTASLAASSSYPDTGGTELTDGAFGSATYADPAWQGRLTDSPYSFTVDLGSDQTFQEVDSDWLQVDSAAIYLPAELEVSVSTDGTTFTPIGTMTAPAVDTSDQTHDYRLLYINVTARYVRITVTPASSAWSFTDELEVRTP
jgi:Domain of unknown function (DUF4434)/F5/8 type C domain/Domain of unknown function (DUF5109)/Fibronectin type III domain